METRIFSLLILILAATVMGCGSMETQTLIRPVHERYRGNMQLESNVRAAAEQTHTRNGVEVALMFKEAGEEAFTGGDLEPGEFKVFRLPELFLDVNYMNLNDHDYRGLDADGYALGIGIKTPPPTRPGWGVDFGARLGFFALDFDESTWNGLNPAWDYDGLTSDWQLGGFHAFNVGEANLLTPMAGLYYKTVDDGWNWLGDLYGGSDDDFHLYSGGVYLGLKLNHASLENYDVSLDYFTGTASVSGLHLAAALRF